MNYKNEYMKVWANSIISEYLTITVSLQVSDTQFL